LPLLPIYVAAKHGVSLTPTTALEYATEDIRINAIYSGFIFLALEDSSFMTGTAFEMDGGYLAQ
jgi:NAD(P)-dependent dehydrogenase (short-subunit alcohol dehydrogenase family)